MTNDAVGGRQGCGDMTIPARAILRLHQIPDQLDAAD